MEWYAIRCVFRDTKNPTSYEERATLWRADSFDKAIERAEAEGREYADALSLGYLGLAQAYELADEPRDGAEVFSLWRESELDSAVYLNTFFDTGTERQGQV